MPRKHSQAAKDRKGTTRPDRVARLPELRPLTRAPVPPPELPPEAADHWRRLARLLVRRGVLTAGDLPGLEETARAAAMAERLHEAARGAPLTIPAARGGEQLHPVLAECRRWDAALLGWYKSFGLLPSARAGVEPVPDASPGGLDGLLAPPRREGA